MRESELLFPAEDGSFRSRSALKKPFVSVASLPEGTSGPGGMHGGMHDLNNDKAARR
jgi:hypothetical protein